MFTALVTLAVLSAEPTHEITVAPTVEWSAKFTHHEGTQLRYDYHLARGLSLFGAWREHWSAGTAHFNHELIENVREEAQVSTVVLLRRAFVAGMSAQPFSGELSNGMAVALRFSAGAGVSGTQVEIAPSGAPRMYADAGARETGFAAVELRVAVTERIVIAAMFDQLVFPSYVTELNGCNVQDLHDMDAALRAGKTLQSVETIRSSCQLDSFPGHATPMALGAVEAGTTDIRQVRSASLGVSVVF